LAVPQAQAAHSTPSKIHRLHFLTGQSSQSSIRQAGNWAKAVAAPKLIEAFEQAKRASSAGEVVKLITQFDLPREAIPTQWLNEAVVWAALLERLPMTAMVHSLGKLTTDICSSTAWFRPMRARDTPLFQPVPLTPRRSSFITFSLLF
jgi:hypothetical protein